MIEERVMSRDQIEKMINSKIRKIDTFFLARIIEYDHIENMATIQPLDKLYVNEVTLLDPPLVMKCPVMIMKSKDFYLRVPYSENDVVYCGCSKEALDDLIITGRPELNKLREERRFDFNDAVILGGISVDNEGQLSEMDSGSFLIENRNTGAKISFNSDGSLTIDKTNGIIVKDKTSITLDGPSINIKGEVKIDGDINHAGDMKSSGEHTVKDTLASGVSLVNHIHKYTHNTPLDRVTAPPTK